MGGTDWLIRVAESDPALFVRLLASCVPKTDLLRIDLPKVETAADVSQAVATVIGAVASGQIATDEAQALAGLLETQRRTIELTAIEARLSALEEQHHVQSKNSN